MAEEYKKFLSETLGEFLNKTQVIELVAGIETLTSEEKKLVRELLYHILTATWLVATHQADERNKNKFY